MAKILIVDDARVMRFHISKMLTELGHIIVAQAKDGAEAIEAFKEHRPDFVTMDIEMPPSGEIEGGVHALQKILEIDSKAIVIMVSAQADKNNIAKALQYGANNFIKKPITLQKLEDLIDHLGFKP